MNYKGKHKKFQKGGPKIDPKVVEQMNKYMSGNNGDIQSRFALDTRVAIANDPVKIKERKKENTKKNYQNLRRVPNLKLYGDKELQMLADKPKDQWPEHVRNSLDNLESDEQRVMMHPDFDRNRPVSEQMELNRDNSLRTRVLRGRNTFMNSSGIPIVSDIAKMVAAPGSSFANLTMDAENQYVKPGLGQGLFNLGMDALNVFPNETAGLFNKGYQKLRPNIKSSFRPSEKGLQNIETIPDQTAKNLEDLQYAKEKFGNRYTIPENLERIAKSKVLTDRTIRGLVNRDNTFVRGVSTNWKELEKYSPSALEHLKKVGIDYSKNPKQAAEYMATHIPPQTGYGRAGMKSDMFNANLDGLYTSNSKATAEGYTYGDGYIVKVKKPTDFSSTNRQEWIEKNKVNYIEPKRLSQSDVNKLDEFKMNNNDIMNSYHKKRYEEAIPDIKKAEDAKDWLKKQQIEMAWAKKAEDDFNKYAAEQTGLDKKLGFNIDYKPGDIIKTSAKKTISPKQLGVGDKNINIRKIHEEILPKLDLSAVKRLNLESDLGDLAGELKQTGLKSPEIAEKLKSYLVDKYNNPYAHYIHLGNPGQKIFEPISSTEMNLFNYKNKSRAHTGTYSKGLSAAALAAPIVGNFLSQQEETPKKGFKEGGQITMNYRGKKCMECGDNPKMQTAGEMQCPQGYTSDGYGNCIPDEPKKFNMYTVPEQTPDEMAALSKFGDWWKRGRPNQFKTTGNEGTDANPMGRGPVDNGPEPEKTPEKPKVNPFLAMRNASTAASLIGNIVARKAQNSYEYNQMTALGQMNPIDSDQFQPTYNNMYAEQGGMINPFSTYSKYGGNLKKIFSQFKQNQEYSNKAQMDMGDGKLDDQGMMERGGYNIPDEYTHDLIKNLLNMGRFHENYKKGTKPTSYRPKVTHKGEMQGGGDFHIENQLRNIQKSLPKETYSTDYQFAKDAYFKYLQQEGRRIPTDIDPKQANEMHQYMLQNMAKEEGRWTGTPIKDAAFQVGNTLRSWMNDLFKTHMKKGGKLKSKHMMHKKMDMDMDECPTCKDNDMDEMKKGGIHIKKENKGKFTASAKSAGMGIQEFARHVLANKENYSSTQVKRANFARNASKWRPGGQLTPNKARMILHDGTIHGKSITDKQRRYFGAMSKGNTMNYRGHK